MGLHRTASSLDFYLQTSLPPPISNGHCKHNRVSRIESLYISTRTRRGWKFNITDNSPRSFQFFQRSKFLFSSLSSSLPFPSHFFLWTTFCSSIPLLSFFFFIIRRWVIAPLDSSRCNWTDFGRDGNDPHTPSRVDAHYPCERPLHAKCETVRFEIRARWIGEEARFCSFPTLRPIASSGVRDREWEGGGLVVERERREGGRVGVEKGKWAASHVLRGVWELLQGSWTIQRAGRSTIERSANGRWYSR